MGAPACIRPITAAEAKPWARKRASTSSAPSGATAASRPPLVWASAMILRSQSGTASAKATSAPKLARLRAMAPGPMPSRAKPTAAGSSERLQGYGWRAQVSLGEGIRELAQA